MDTDVKIVFVNQNGLENTVFDSSLIPAKCLLVKTFQPGDTHVGLNMAVNEDQILIIKILVKLFLQLKQIME